MEGKIEHSKTDGRYILQINGEYIDEFDTFQEAVEEYEAYHDAEDMEAITL